MSNELYGLLTKEGVTIPLTAVEVRGDITGRSAKVKICQNFRNTESKAMEAIYKFPLPEGSSICRFRAVVDKKIIQGEIEEREKAFELYDKAISQGDGAYLLDQERPNIFTLSLGNLNPGASAVIEVDYVVLLDTHESEARFFLPTTISPRYLPPNTKDVKGIPAHELVNPPVALEVSYGLKITLEIQGKEFIQTLGSPSHTISTTYGDNSIKVELTSETTAMDRDFILNINYQKDFETRGYLSKKGDESFIQLDFSPKTPATSGKNSSSKQEIIFVLDCSGSMQGSSITEAKQALTILLKALEVGTLFNIYTFGSTFSSLFTASVIYNEINLETALKFLSRIDADLGGTEILAPLQAIKQNIPAGNAANIILLTDGEVGNEDQIIDLVKTKDSRMRMFTVGIGNGPNEYFIKQLGRVTGGASELISPDERIEPKVLRLFTKVTSGSIRDLKVAWGTDVLAADVPSVVHFGETVSIFARVTDDKVLPDKIVLSGTVNKSRQEWVCDIDKVEAVEAPLPLFWARDSIRGLEESENVISGSQQAKRKENTVKQNIIKLSKRYGIISRETSFVAVEKRLDSKKTTGEVVLRKVPVMLTKDWGGIGKTSTLFLSRSAPHVFSNVKNYMVDDNASAVYERYSPPRLRSDEDDRLMAILALQKAEGGFEIDAAFAGILKVNLSDLQNMAFGIEADQSEMEAMIFRAYSSLSDMLHSQKFARQLEIDPAVAKNFEVAMSNLQDMASRLESVQSKYYVMFSTAIVLSYLDHKYATQRATWERVVLKSQQWLEDRVTISGLKMKGVSLKQWADDFLQARGSFN